MFENFSEMMLQLLLDSFWETLIMVGISGLIGGLIGIPLGVGVIVITIVLTNIYVRRANTEFDEINRQIVAEAKK